MLSLIVGRRIAIVGLIVLLIWAAATAAGVWDEPEPLALRSKAAPFRLPVVQEPGQTLALSQLAGKGVLINFWAAWCEPCIDEMPLLKRLHARYGGLHFTVVGVTDDKRRDVERFLERSPLEYPVLHDAKGELRERYRAEVLPFSVYLTPDGRVAGAVAGILDESEAIEAVERLVLQARATQRAQKKAE